MKHIPEFLVVFSHTVACVGVGQKQCEAVRTKQFNPYRTLVQNTTSLHNNMVLVAAHLALMVTNSAGGYKQRWWLQPQLVVTNTAGGYKHSWW